MIEPPISAKKIPTEIQTLLKHNRYHEFLSGRENESFWHMVPIFPVMVKLSLRASSFHPTQMVLAFHVTGSENAYQKN